MKNTNMVFIAKSIDGFIADKTGGLDWLQMIPNPEGEQMGYDKLMNRIDAIIMGRNTFEMVCSFNIPWPYTKPVFVLSTTVKNVPNDLKGKVEIVKGSLIEVIKYVNDKGCNQLYIDGGKTIQSFLREDLIDDLIITTLPILLGGGSSLFGHLSKELEFQHVESKVYLNAIVQDTYKRKRGAV